MSKIDKRKEIASESEKSRAIEEADKLRTELREHCLESDTGNIEEKLAQEVA
jgi:hypothetical protein